MANNRILLVEDNEDSSKLVQFLLVRAGYEIIEARTGQQGWTWHVPKNRI